MKNKHTPGKWKILELDGIPTEIWHASTLIARLFSLNENKKADAKLIAAAPEMLEVLQNVWNCGGSIRPESVIWKDIENVLRKVKSI